MHKLYQAQLHKKSDFKCINIWLQIQLNPDKHN